MSATSSTTRSRPHASKVTDRATWLRILQQAGFGYGQAGGKFELVPLPAGGIAVVLENAALDDDGNLFEEAESAQGDQNE